MKIISNGTRRLSARPRIPSSCPPVKWKNGKDGKYNDTRDARARSCAYTNAMEVSTGQVVPEDQEEKPLLSSSSGNERRKKEKRIILFFPPLPLLLFLFFLSSSSRAEESFFFFFFFFFFRSRSIKIYSRTEAEILPGLPATSESSHIFRHRNVLFLPFFFFVHARNKLLLLRLSKSVKLGRGVFV